MRLLWAKSDFLHPTTRGGQIRTLEILKRLHKQHEVHYVALHRPGETEGIERSSEYCTRAYPIAHDVPDHYSPAFAAQLVRGLFSPLPVAIFRYRSAAMRTKLTELATRVRFDGVVCDFLAPSANFERLDQAVLFQHNVETALWQRHAEHAGSPAKRAYLALQANRMFAF
ncbi:MAG TPA: hypothetical protein VFL57_12905, partial [Bryobacteraceae bacterium]|nr:hypothetical protein [Bryobacteraceae bacterium]